MFDHGCTRGVDNDHDRETDVWIVSSGPASTETARPATETHNQPEAVPEGHPDRLRARSDATARRGRAMSPAFDRVLQRRIAEHLDRESAAAEELERRTDPMTSPTQRRHDEIIGRLDALIDAVRSTTARDNMHHRLAEESAAERRDEPVDVTEEPPVGSQVTDIRGQVHERITGGWREWYPSDAVWGGAWSWEVARNYAPLRLTTDADRERVGLDTAPDVDPDEALAADKIIREWRKQRARAEKAESDVERLTRERDEAREVAKSHVEDARDWRRRYEALRADVDEFQYKHCAYAGTWELDDALARDDEWGQS